MQLKIFAHFVRSCASLRLHVGCPLNALEKIKDYI